MNTNTLAIQPEQFIFSQGEELKTTSLKVADAFGKQHAHVMRDIRNIIDAIKDLTNASNFGLVEYTDEKGEKRPMYEMDKDGFMLVVMKYTGAKAMAIKIAYINAFNLMAEKLFPKRNGLVELTPPAPRAKTQVKGGLELHQQDAINDFIKERLRSLPQHKRGSMAQRIYSAINTKFGTKSTKDGYKNIAPEHFDNIIQHIARLPLDEDQLLLLMPEELDALVDMRVKAKEGELLPREQPAPHGPGGIFINEDQVVITCGFNKAEFLRCVGRIGYDLVDRNDYIVIKKDEVLQKLQA